MGLVVTGILSHGDLKPLEALLKNAGLPLDPIQLISGDDSTEGVARRHIGQGLITGDGAGSVPGINRHGPGLTYFRNETLSIVLVIWKFRTPRSTITSKPSKQDGASSLISQNRRVSRRSKRSSAIRA